MKEVQVKIFRWVPIVAMLFVASSAHALAPSARGLDGSLAISDSGAESLWVNPAALGDPRSMSYAVGAAEEGGGSLVSLQRLRGVMEYDASAETNVINTVITPRNRGKEFGAEAEALGGAAVTWRGIAVGYAIRGGLSIEAASLPLLRVALNRAADAVTPAGKSESGQGTFESVVWGEWVVGYGRRLPIPGVDVSAGVVGKYLIGQDYRYLHDDLTYTAGATAVTYSPLIHDRAERGSGFGADVGLRAKLGPVTVFGAWRNLGATITWKEADRKTAVWVPSTNSFAVASVKQDLERPLREEILAGAGGKIPGLGIAVGAAVEMKTAPDQTRVRLGMEYPLAIVGVRLGYATAAGPVPGMATFGVGVGIGAIRGDVAYGWVQSGRGGLLAASVSGGF